MNGTVGDTGVRTSGVLAAVGGLLIVVGSFMPWIQVQAFVASMSRSGIDGGGDGVLTLLMYVLVFVTGVGWATSQSRKVSWAAPLIPGELALIVAVMSMSDVGERVVEFERTASGLGSASVGAGLRVVLVGAVLR